MCNMAVRAEQKAKQPDKALEQLAGCSKKGLESDLITYNAASSVCEKTKQPYKVIELLVEMPQTARA